MRRLWLWLWLVALLAACGDDGSRNVLHLDIPADCNPLGWGTSCVLPFPSSLFESGGHVDLGATTLPATVDGVAFDPAHLNERTGWSASTQIVWTVPGGVDGSQLVPAREMERTLGDDSPTVLVDLDTGERIMHFAEVDANAFDPTRQAIYIRPAQRLRGGGHYAVAFRRSLRHPDGSAIDRPPAFEALLAQQTTDHARFEAARRGIMDAVAYLYGEVRDARLNPPIPTDDLLVAWDFTVATDESVLTQPRWIRDLAIEAMGPGGANLTYAITSDEAPTDEPRQARRLDLTLTVPRVVDEDGFLHDARGNPTIDLPVHAFVPPCATAKTPAGILIYGHGFFGNLSEVRGASFLRELANEHCLVVIGGEWYGMTSADVPEAALALADLNRARVFSERIWQGIVGFMAIAQLAQGELATEIFGPIVDPSRVAFMGVSQGHILGSVMYAWEPTLTTGVFHAGGGNWSILFERSTNWAIYGAVLESGYGGLLEAVIMQQVLQLSMELVDPLTAAHTTDEERGVPRKSWLFSYSRDDSTVPNLGTEVQLRTLAVGIATPATYVAPGLEERPSSGAILFDEATPPAPPESNLVNRTGNDNHDNPRRREAFRRMIARYLELGFVNSPCEDVPCACATGACGPLLE